MRDLSEYKTNSYNDILDNVPFGQRGEADALTKAKFMYSEYMNGKSGICHSDVERFRTNRLYSAGSQSSEPYFKILMGKTQDGQAVREGEYNIDKAVFSVAPKYMSITVSKIMAVDHNIFIDTIDSLSQKEKLTKEVDDKLNIIFKKQMDELGISNKTANLPDSLEEYDMIKKELGVRLGVEAMTEAMIYFTYDYSNWKQIKERMVKDEVENAICACKDYVNQQTQMVEVRYVDPERAIVQYSREPDFKNSEYFGEFVDYTISDLKEYFSQEELKEIAESYRSFGGNDPLLEFSFTDGHCNFANYATLVMDFEYKSVDDDNGTPVVMWNKAKWIVGTDKTFEVGPQRDIPRPDNFEANSSYHFRRLSGKSIIERCRPNFDSLCLTWYKLQNLKNMARIPGLAIEFSSLMNISIGDAKTPMDLLKITRATGDVLYKATTHRGIVNNNGMKPIQELQGGMGAYLQQLIQTFEFDLQQISELSGIDRISAISKTPSSEQTVGVTELAVSATDNALNPLYLGYIDIKEATAENITIRVQDLIRFNKKGRLAYADVIGDAGVNMMRSKEGIINRRLGIKIEARPSANEMMDITNALNVAMQAGKNGIPLITFDDYLMIKDLLKTPNGIKQARQLLSFKMKKRAEEQQANAEKSMMAQKQGEGQVLMLKQKGDKEQKEFETNEAIRLEYFKALIEVTITNEDQIQRESKLKVLEAALQQGQQIFQAGMGQVGVPQGQQAMM